MIRAVIAAAAVLVVAGCSTSTEPDRHVFGGVGGPSTSAEELAKVKQAAGIEGCPETGTAAIAAEGGLPDVTLECLGGGRNVHLAAVADQPTVINLWASWCKPCRRELPLFQRLHETESDVQVLGIDFADDAPGDALALAQSTGVTFPLLTDPTGVLKNDLKVIGLPQTVFLNGQGRIVATERKEFRSYDDLAAAVKQHLGVSP